MGLRKKIEGIANDTAATYFANLGYTIKARNKGCSGFAKVKGYKDGQYVVEMADGSTKSVDPSGVRGVGPGGIIYLAGDFQVF